MNRAGPDRGRLVSLSLLVAGVFSVSLPAFVQQPAPTRPNAAGGGETKGTGLILGQVVDAETGQPIPDAVVSTNIRPAAPIRGAGPGGIPGGGVGVVPGPPQLRVVTSTDGRFLFYELPAGPYLLTAAAPGYLNGASGQTRPAGTSNPITLEDGQRLADVKIRLWRHAVVSGRVLDERDEPAVRVQVRALRRVPRAGRIQFQQAGQEQTDDRGMFRIGSLAPGDYVIVVPFTYTTAPAAVLEDMYSGLASGRGMGVIASIALSRVPLPSPDSARVGDFVVGASPLSNSSLSLPPADADGQLQVYSTTYYPGTADVTASTVVTLRSGEDRSGVDFRLGLVPTGRVVGTVIDANGPAANVGVRLVPKSSDTAIDATAGITAADGSFTILGAQFGEYIARIEQRPAPQIPASQGPNPMAQAMLGALAGMSNEPRYADAPVSVGAGTTSEVSLALRPGAKIRGRVVFEGSLAQPTAQQLQAMTVGAVALDGRASPPAAPAAGGQRPGQVGQTAEFVTQGYPPGKYLLSLPTLAAGGWRLASIAADGRDASVTPLELGTADVTDVVATYTDRAANLSGSTRDRSGAAVRATLFVFPFDYRTWIDNGMPARVVVTSMGPTFNLRMSGGDYLAVAVLDAEPNDRNDPEFIERVARLATRVSLADGETRTLDLVAVSIVR